MRQAREALDCAGRAIEGLMGIADLMEADPGQQRIAAALRSLAHDADESVGAACAEIDRCSEATDRLNTVSAA
ncbi:MAG: hypothetical protein FKY71_04650 [Spiribacter salinus]|uniref:Uncharacterized protein n=1 Tax=Spiribacter salinus TaxID=1335746 RepID=A0A540VTW9_9GAMM|nr:MAG: hypothetical protein FKY71_04650 [Spiribacter salinus]